ncbi:FliI/YscN family ATPase [Stenotrophomonas tumulicola]|uniref:protein-secreting ATPase n=2 Tax=Stenotrophomonas tumulicola TaxID=1685415 RepID=A0A7W3IIB9_9GAMM|nr:FliI/YscN family ATPase [Stenotrophomonas tumulicola]
MSARPSLWQASAHPTAIIGSILRAPLPQVSMGELCLIQASPADDAVVGRGTVVAVEQGVASIGLLRENAGLSLRCLVFPTGHPPTIATSSMLLGSVLDAEGREVERLFPGRPGAASVRPLTGEDSDYRQREAITSRLCTGLRAIDGLLTCGEGQRVGIFAGAGAGKTTLSEMLLDNADVDVCVVALIGERGREVATLVERMRGSAQGGRTVIVQATSDKAPALRSQAALLATTIAEHFRDAGKRVLLIMDSVTRYARALRELALGAGEPPARRGYPASVFEALPRLLERSGRSGAGSITAFYTVLLEDEQDADPIGEEVKSLLDGHLHLSSKLAGRGHYPALDILKSGSRLFTQLADNGQRQVAEHVRTLLGTLDDLQLMRDLGEYKPGISPHYDAAVRSEPKLMAFLRQSREEPADLGETLRRLHAIAE